MSSYFHLRDHFRRQSLGDPLGSRSVRVRQTKQEARVAEAVAQFNKTHPEPNIEDVIRYIVENPVISVKWDRLSTAEKVTLVLSLGIVLTGQGIQLGQALGNTAIGIRDFISHVRDAFRARSSEGYPRQHSTWGPSPKGSHRTRTVVDSDTFLGNGTALESGPKPAAKAPADPAPKAASASHKHVQPSATHVSYSVVVDHSNSTHVKDAASVAPAPGLLQRAGQAISDALVSANEFAKRHDPLKFPGGDAAPAPFVPGLHDIDFGEHLDVVERRDVAPQFNSSVIRPGVPYVASAYTQGGEAGVITDPSGNSIHVISVGGSRSVHIRLTDGEPVTSLTTSVLSENGASVSAYRVGDSWRAAVFNVSSSASATQNATIFELPSAGVTAMRVQAQPNGGFLAVYTATNGTYAQSYRQNGSLAGDAVQLSSSSSSTLDVYQNSPKDLTVTWREGSASFGATLKVTGDAVINASATSPLFPDTRTFRSAGNMVVSADPGTPARLLVRTMANGNESATVAIEPPSQTATLQSYTMTNSTVYTVYLSTDATTSVSRLIFGETQINPNPANASRPIDASQTHYEQVKANVVNGLQLGRSPDGSQVSVLLESSGIGNSYRVTIDPVSGNATEVQSVEVGEFTFRDILARVPSHGHEAVFVYKCPDGSFCALPVDFERPAPTTQAPPGTTATPPNAAPASSSSSSAVGLITAGSVVAVAVVLIVVGVPVLVTRYNRKQSADRVSQQDANLGANPTTIALKADSKNLLDDVQELQGKRLLTGEDADLDYPALFSGGTSSITLQTDNPAIEGVGADLTFDTYAPGSVKTAKDSVGIPRVYSLKYAAFDTPAGSADLEVRCKYDSAAGNWKLVTDGKKEGCTKNRFVAVLTFPTLESLHTYLLEHHYISEGSKTRLVYKPNDAASAAALVTKTAAAEVDFTRRITRLSQELGDKIKYVGTTQTPSLQTAQDYAHNADVAIQFFSKLSALLSEDSLLTPEARFTSVRQALNGHGSIVRGLIEQFVKEGFLPAVAGGASRTSFERLSLYDRGMSSHLLGLLKGVGAAAQFLLVLLKAPRVEEHVTQFNLFARGTSHATLSIARSPMPSLEAQVRGFIALSNKLNEALDGLKESVYQNGALVPLEDTDAAKEWAANVAVHEENTAARQSALTVAFTKVEETLAEVRVADTTPSLHGKIERFLKQVKQLEVLLKGLAVQEQHFSQGILVRFKALVETIPVFNDGRQEVDIRALLTKTHGVLTAFCEQSSDVEVLADLERELDLEISRENRRAKSSKEIFVEARQQLTATFLGQPEYLTSVNVFSTHERRSQHGVLTGELSHQSVAGGTARYAGMAHSIDPRLMRYCGNHLNDHEMLLEGLVANGNFLKGSARPYSNIGRFCETVLPKIGAEDFLVPVGCPVEIDRFGLTDKHANYYGALCLNPEDSDKDRFFVFVDYRQSDHEIQAAIDAQLEQLGIAGAYAFNALIALEVNAALRNSFLLACNEFSAAGHPIGVIQLVQADGHAGHKSVYHLSVQLGDKDVQIWSCPTIPDHKELDPNDPGFINLVFGAYRQIQEQLRDANAQGIDLDPNELIKFIAHCSAGIGRSGMLAGALFALLNRDKYLTGEVALNALIHDLRVARHYAIQDNAQLPAMIDLAFNVLDRIFEYEASLPEDAPIAQPQESLYGANLSTAGRQPFGWRLDGLAVPVPAQAAAPQRQQPALRPALQHQPAAAASDTLAFRQPPRPRVATAWTDPEFDPQGAPFNIVNPLHSSRAAGHAQTLRRAYQMQGDEAGHELLDLSPPGALNLDGFHQGEEEEDEDTF